MASRAQPSFLHLRKLTCPLSLQGYRPALSSFGSWPRPQVSTASHLPESLTRTPLNTSLAGRPPQKGLSVTSLLQTSRGLQNEVWLPDSAQASAHPASRHPPCTGNPIFISSSHMLSDRQHIRTPGPPHQPMSSAEIPGLLLHPEPGKPLLVP